ncbi:diguanylate cyclase domain-containing protein [Agaribacterium sp. ZY112]|uniref:diguanylate cyclase domain-containing protein n=1 Tax=Agaribacterium sp. ZY112 TaxID=3233574 RepID=UPI003526ADC8
MKLGPKLALYIAAIAILFALVMSAVSYVSLQKRVALSSESSIDSLIATVYSMASTAAYIEDSELAREVIEGLALNDLISCARLSTESMTVSSSPLCPAEKTFRRLIISSPWDKSEEVGSLDVFLNHKHVAQQARDQVYYAALVLLSVILLISASISLITYLLVTKPISRMSSQLRMVDFEHNVHLLKEGGRKDELGVIGKVINLMLVNAKKQIITEQILARKTEEISKHVKLVFDLSDNYLAVCDERLMLRSSNPKFESLVKAALGENVFELNKDGWLSAFTDQEEELKKSVKAHDDYEHPHSIEVSVDLKNEKDGTRYYKFTFVKIFVEGNFDSVLVYIVDLTEDKKRLVKTEYEASHDDLTQLYNRLAAVRKARHMLSAHEDGQEVAIVFIDLDGFKAINDSLGHDAGDQLLKVVAQRIADSVRKTDIAARWGGDEFLLALSCVNENQAIMVGEKVLKSIVQPILLKDESGKESEQYVGASIGIAISHEHLSDFSTLSDQADKAMYQVKKSGKNAVLMYRGD